MAPSSPVPPGWYPDPQADPATPGRLRWWDGQGWTQHTHQLMEAGAHLPPPAPDGAAGGAQPAFVVPGAVARPGETATFWVRAGASLIEGAIWTGLQMVALMGVALAGAMLSTLSLEWLAAVVAALIVWVAPSVIQAVLEGQPQAQNYSKHLLRVAVVDADTGAPGIGWRRSIVRQLAKILSALPLGLGLLWPLWDEQRRTFHDMLTNTRVVRADQPKVQDPVAFLRHTGVPARTAAGDQPA